MIRNHRMVQLQKAAKLLGFGTYGNYKYRQYQGADMHIWLDKRKANAERK